MSKAKIAAIGAGSFVFSLGLFYDLIIKNRLSGTELVLMDVNEAMVNTMAGIARRMAADAGIAMDIHATADRTAALQGADYVTSSVAIQLLKRWQMDKEVLHRHGIVEITSECGGLGGLSYTLRQVNLLMGIARDMERYCPQAWLLNVSNPLPRVITAITKHTKIRAAGFCNVAWGAEDGYGSVGRLLGRNYHELEVVSAGLNHFAWLLTVRDRVSGADLMPQVQQIMAAGGSVDGPLTNKWWRQYGFLPLAGDAHSGEFFPFDAELGREHTAHHGDAQERAARQRELEAAAAGEIPWQSLLTGRCWERPGDVIAALMTGNPYHLDIINIPNHGAIAGLPDDAVVEVPADVCDGTIHGQSIGALPASIADICAKVSATHTLAAEAAVTGDRTLLEEVIRIDPAITQKQEAMRAMQELLDVHADVLPQFA